MIHENDHWILSFYRSSEISGALFFGRLARSLRPGPIQVDMTKHFADESQHAWYWTRCLQELDVQPIKIIDSYQDQYVSAVGLPANIMEVLAITQVFERRVINQYNQHASLPGLHPAIKSTFETIMKDEVWHIRWVGDALKSLEGEFGKEHIVETLKRFTAADRTVYEATLVEHEQRLSHLIRSRQGG